MSPYFLFIASYCVWLWCACRTFSILSDRGAAIWRPLSMILCSWAALYLVVISSIVLQES